MIISAQEALKYTVPGYSTAVQTVLQSSSPKIQEVIDSIESVLDEGTDNFDEGVEYARYGYWFIFGISIIIILLMGWLLIILCCMCQRNKCWDQKTCAKILLGIVGFLIIIFAVLVFIIMVGSATMSGVCGFVGKLNKDQAEVLYEFDELNANVRKISELCLFTNSTGHINEMFLTGTT